MNKRALEQLASMLETKVEAKYFDLSGWVGNDDDFTTKPKYQMSQSAVQEKFSEVENVFLVPHACGTTCCAVGYAGLDEWFSSNGFRTDLYYGHVYFTPEGREGEVRYTGWDAVTTFFDISENKARMLFNSNHYVKGAGPSLVAERIREFIAKDGDIHYDYVDDEEEEEE